ncbi:hypothetical protein [Lentzea sp. E54]|uniref:hypothetical protein n=1 Tax=Lentzea xerophila TaxID=3435883 RepID=UPI003DA6431F
MRQYLEPRTDVPARDDWSTRLALADVRISTRQHVESLIAVVTFVITFFVPSTPGNTAAKIVLGVLVVLSLGALLPNRAVRRALRSGLLDEPWRRAPAAVAEKCEDDPGDRLLLDGLVLKGWFHDLLLVVLDRQEAFVCGPDAEGHAVVRAAGSTSMCVVRADEGEYRPREREERPLGRPRDDERVQDGLRMSRSVGRYFWLFHALTALVVGALVALSISPFAPTGLVAAAMLAPGLLGLPAMIEVVRRERDIARAVESSPAWSSVPITLFPWTRGYHVAGIAQMPGGPALVRFPRPSFDLVANIADTGAMWIAGTHRGILAVGVPGTSHFMFAVARPDSAVQSGDPMSWWRRWGQNDFSVVEAQGA